jgi:hypothetical protein
MLYQLCCTLQALLAGCVEMLAGFEFEIAQVATGIHGEMLFAHFTGLCRLNSLKFAWVILLNVWKTFGTIL